MSPIGSTGTFRTAERRPTSSRTPKKLRASQRDPRHRGDTATTHVGAERGSDGVVRRATRVCVLLGAVWLSPQTVGQALDAAQVRMDTATSATAKSDTGGPQEAVSSSFLIDLGPFEADPQALAVGPQSGPPLIGLHRPAPHAFSGDLVPQIMWSSAQGDESTRGAFTVCSRGAASIRVRVAARLPDAAVVTVFDGDRGSPRGPWTGAEIGEDGADGAWLPAQDGECVVVEITLAHAADAETASLWLRNVAHRFTGEELETAHAAAKRAKRTGTQANPQSRMPRHASAHRPQCPARYVSVCERLEPSNVVAAHATAVAHYHFETAGGTFLCTGTLLNDGRDEGAPRDPLFLTAAHCVSTHAEARSMDLAFDWIDRTCSPEPTKRLARPAQLLATAQEFDQTLVRLAAWPAPHSVVGRYALGWNASTVEAQTRTRTLSHPGGARLAYTAATVTGVRRQPVPVSDYGLVYNAIDVLELDGITEEGSSGERTGQGRGPRANRGRAFPRPQWHPIRGELPRFASPDRGLRRVPGFLSANRAVPLKRHRAGGTAAQRVQGAVGAALAGDARGVRADQLARGYGR